MIQLLLWLLVPTANAIWDRKGRKPNYLAMFCARAAAGILYGILLVPSGVNFSDESAGRLMVIAGVIFLYEVCTFWLWFELLLNILRRKPLLYYDTVERDSGGIDRFFAKHPHLHKPAKLGALIIAVLSGLVIYYWL